MKTMLAALASASLLATSLAAVAGPAEAQARVGARGAVVSQPHFRGGGGGFRGGYSPGWGYRGGYRGYSGGAWAGATLGFALGANLAYPWYYGPPVGYYGYPDYGYYGGYVAPAPEGYAGDPWAYDYGTSVASPSTPGAQPPAQACGSWSWDQAQSKYNWIPCPPSGG